MCTTKVADRRTMVRPPNLDFLLLFFLLPITTNTIVTTSRLFPRKSVSTQTYDPFIVCEGGAPNHSEGLPPNYLLNDYVLNLHLCSSVHGVAHHNVGCFCSRAGGNVRCDENLADPTLWNAVYRSSDPGEVEDAIDRGFPLGVLPFPEYCWSLCLCVDAETALETGGVEYSDAISVFHRLRADGLTRERQQQQQQQQGGSASVWNPFLPQTFAAGGVEGSARAGGRPAVQNQCGNNCTRDRDCKGSRPGSAAEVGEATATAQGSNCSCRTQSSQYQPGSGAVAFVAACLIDMASRGGKRDEEWPCPCNDTYVSHECCGAGDGLVWETAELKLGELVK